MGVFITFLMFDFFDRFAERPLCCPTALLNDCFLFISAKIFSNLCKGTARSKGIVIILFAFALFIPTCRDEIYRIVAEDIVRPLISL